MGEESDFTETLPPEIFAVRLELGRFNVAWVIDPDDTVKLVPFDPKLPDPTKDPMVTFAEEPEK